MGNFQYGFLMTTLMLLAAGNASADSQFWVGAKAGTLGLGLEGTWRPIDWMDLRVGGNVFDYNETGSQAGIDYDATLELQTFYATANLRFPLSPFRVTVGMFSNSNSIKMLSVDQASYDIGGFSFTPEEVGQLEGRTNWDSTSPYIGAGFDFEIFNRVGLNLDFGVLWQGDPKVSLTSTGTLANDQNFQDLLAAEIAELEDDFDALKAYPVISVGFNFAF